jgi:Protein of unknown function (DUF2281)
MVVLTATCRNGVIELDQPLPSELEGKQVQVTVQEVELKPRKRRQAGSAKAKGQIWIAPDFDEPLEDFQEYQGNSTIDSVLKHFGVFADDPTFDDFLEEVAAYRQQMSNQEMIDES